jgi:enoyl-CoA hydratase/carnithine racemase
MPVVKLVEHPCRGDLVLAHAELNSPSTLNSLSLDMVRELTRALQAWAIREDVVAVVITGAGDRAFCAGGDIQALYRAIRANQAADRVVDDYPFRFFEEEYRLDYSIHTYPKPVITLGHGIVMGGGFGILSASRYRVLTATTRLALPEITIGLFPDAGASWTLRSLPTHWAAFLGLTGSHVNVADGVALNLGTHVDAAAGVGFVERLVNLPWQAEANLAMLDVELASDVDMPASDLNAVPEREVDVDDLAGEAAAIESLAGRSPWVDRGIQNLVRGCPTTAGIVLEQLKRVPEMTLAETYRMELTIATHCARNRDFVEGVRALLIEKDNSPRWQYGDIANLPHEHVLSHFAEPWDSHPLNDLGDEVTSEV